MKKTYFQCTLIVFLCGVFLASQGVCGNESPDRAIKTPSKAETVSGYRLALVIGNSSYASSPLKNPVHDAEIMEKGLKQCGFDVIKACDLSQKKMKRKVDEFGKKLKKNGGIGLFYYAGHGLQVKGRNYLVPVDAHIQSEEDVEYEAMDAGRVLAKMEAAGNTLNIVILDACRDNPFTRSYRSSSHGLAHMDAPAGTLIAYATSPGSVASDGLQGQGLFTGELVKYMAVPGLKIEDVFKKVRVNVGKATDKGQIPWESSSLVGDFYFTRPSASASTGEPLNVTPVEPIKRSLNGVWKRTGKRYFSIRIRDDKAIITDASRNKKIPGIVILKNIQQKDGYWVADRARISKNGEVLDWGTARLEIKGGMLVEHLEFKKDLINTYERIE